MNQNFKYKLPSSPKGKHYSNPLGPSFPLPNDMNNYKENLYNKIDYFSQQTNYNPERFSTNIKRRYDYSPLYLLRNTENNFNNSDKIDIKMGFNLLTHKFERINNLLDKPLTNLEQSFKNKMENRTFSLNKIYEDPNFTNNFKNSPTSISTMDNNYSNFFMNNTQKSNSSKIYNSTQNLLCSNHYNDNLIKKNLTISTDNYRKISSISPEYNNNFSFRGENSNNKYKKIIIGRTLNNENNTQRNINNNNIIQVNLKRSENISFNKPLNTNRIYNERDFYDINNSKRHSLRNKIKNNYGNFQIKNQNFPNSINKNNSSFNLMTTKPKERINLEKLKYNNIQTPNNLIDEEKKIIVNKNIPKNNNIEIEGYENQEYNNNIHNPPENSFNIQNNYKKPISLKIKEIKDFSNINTPLIRENLFQKDSSGDFINKNNYSNDNKNDNTMENFGNNDDKEIGNNIEYNKENYHENNIGNNENNNDNNNSFQNNNFINDNLEKEYSVHKKFKELKKELKNSISYISNLSHNIEMKEMPQDNYENKIGKKYHQIILKDGEKEKVIEPDYYIIKDGEKEIKKIKINQNLIENNDSFKKKNSCQNQKETIAQDNISLNLNNKDNVEINKEQKNILDINNLRDMNQIKESKTNKNNKIKINEIIDNNYNENNIEKENENKILKKDNNILNKNNNNNDNLKTENLKNEHSEEEERTFKEITKIRKESVDKENSKRIIKVNSDFETPKDELDNANKLITFSEKHIIKFDGKETLTHLSIFDQNSTPQDKSNNDFNIPTKLTPLVINSPSENKENENLFNINTNEKNKEKIYIQENINFKNDRINNENKNNNESSRDKQIALEKLSQLIDEVNENESYRQRIPVNENQNIFIEKKDNNIENMNNDYNSNLNNNSEKTNNESENNKDNTKHNNHTKNYNVNNNININIIEKQNKNQIHKPIQKAICPKFVNNPQHFFTEDVCENVLKSYDIPINIYNQSNQNSSNTNISSNKNPEKTLKTKTIFQNNKIIVSRKLIPKNNKKNINTNKIQNQDNSNLKFNIYNFTTFGQNQQKTK